MFYYTILQTFIWAFLHAFFLFWGVYFPFSYRKLQMSGQVRYAHIASILVALVVPLLPALLPLKDGFLNTRNPSLACLGRNSDYTYFLLVLPLSIIGCSIACLMILTFWKILNVIIRMIQGLYYRNSSNSSQGFFSDQLGFYMRSWSHNKSLVRKELRPGLYQGLVL